VLLTVAGKERECHSYPLLSDIEKKFIRLVLYLKDKLVSMCDFTQNSLGSGGNHQCTGEAVIAPTTKDLSQ
jgi:hypothetical protein